MAIQRSTVLKGPAIVQMSSQSIYTQGDIRVTQQIATFPINTSAYGKVDERISDIITDITFVPAGEWETALLAVLFPWTNPVAGTSMFTGTDVPVIIHPLNSLEKITYPAGAVIKMPDIILSAVKTAFGSMTIRCIGKDNTAWTDAAKRYVIADASFTDTAFTTANIKTVPYSLALTGGTTPWNSFRTRDGATISFDLQTADVFTDDEGLIDMSIQGLAITVRAALVGITMAQLLTKLNIQGSGVLRGVSLAGRAANLTIAGATAGDPSVVVNSAVLKSAPHAYGQENLRIAECEFIATRTTGSGAMFSVSTV
jgi:hypothetical protein